LDVHARAGRGHLGYFSDRRFEAGCVSVTLAFSALFGTIFLTQYLTLVAGAPGRLATTSMDSSHGQVAVFLSLAGLGMGLTGRPDTTRQVGKRSASPSSEAS
jgi:hypothetical protein